MSPVSFAMFFLVLTLVLVALDAYAYRWIIQAFSPSRRVRIAIVAMLAASLVGMALGRIADRLWTEAPVRALLVVSSTIQLAVIMSAVLLLLVDGGLVVARLIRRLHGAGQNVEGRNVEGPEVELAASAPDPSTVPPSTLRPPAPELPRRAFLAQAAAGSAFLVGGSSSLYGALAGRHDYAIEDVPVRIPGLSHAMDGFTIVQLSDVHIGAFVGEAELAAAIDLVRRARPDLIVLTGDLLDHDQRLAERLGRFVRRLQPLARQGVFGITGNHDYYAGVAAMTAAVEAGGGTMLRNRGRIVGEAGAGFALLGVDDVWAARSQRGGGPDLDRAVKSLPELGGTIAAARDLPRILLCHNPSYFEQAAGDVALQLSGHTHGGQVNLVVRPADLFLKNGWVAGSYDRNGSRLYVNRGFGTVGPPARVGAPPEVSRIILTA